MISLGSGSPAPESFPVRDVTVTLQDGSTLALGESATAAAMQYSPTAGLPELVQWVAELQAVEHRWQHETDGHICVTTGSQNALHLALQMLLSEGDTLLADEFLYPGALETVRPMGVLVHGVAGDEGGMDPEALEAALAGGTAGRRPRVLYTVPSGHNPTGTTLSNERRKRM